MATTETGLSFELRTLNDLRRRLMTINGALFALRNEIQNPYIIFPPWDRLIKLVADLGQMTSTLQQFLNNESAFGRPKPKDPTKEESYDENYGVEQMGASTETFNIPHFLNSAVVHPTTAFPREQENILGTLLTKKLAPVIEDWIEEGVKVAKDELGEDGGEKERGLAPEEFKKLWVWAVLEANDIGKKVALDEEEEYEEGDEGSREGSPGSDIEMTDVAASEALRKGKAQALEGKAMMPLDDILKFVSTGSVR